MDTRDAHARALEFFSERVAAVRDDQWDDATPCSEWDVRALVNHLTYENLWCGELFAGRTLDEVGDRYEGRDLLGDDPKAAYAESARVASEAVGSPGAMDREVHTSAGRVSGHHYASELIVDLLVHGWDLAAGTGQDQHMPEPLADDAYEFCLGGRDMIRASGLFGDDVPVSEDADVQTKLLALLGRDASAW